MLQIQLKKICLQSPLFELVNFCSNKAVQLARLYYKHVSRRRSLCHANDRNDEDLRLRITRLQCVLKSLLRDPHQFWCECLDEHSFLLPLSYHYLKPPPIQAPTNADKHLTL